MEENNTKKKSHVIFNFPNKIIIVDIKRAEFGIWLDLAKIPDLSPINCMQREDHKLLVHLIPSCNN